jgi:hypothetical protein
MKLAEFADALADATHLPVVWLQWHSDEAPPMPWLVWYTDGNHPFIADNMAYYDAVDITVELYSAEKDFESEAAIKVFFNSIEIIPEEEEEWLDDEKMLMHSYTFTFGGN